MKPSKVFVYRNIRNGLYSVRDCKTGRVIKRLKKIRMRNCQFRVGEAGRQRVITTGHKNVHAGVVGYLSTKPLPKAHGRATYNPWMWPMFYDIVTNAPVKAASVVHLGPNGRVEYAY